MFTATFPAGTLSGAPKNRAIELIHEFEAVSRGIYGGTVGYFSFDGNMDMAIAIRTAYLAQTAHMCRRAAGLLQTPKRSWNFGKRETKLKQ